MDSVVIPVYNEEKILERTIEKVYGFLKSEKRDFELIIANDGSRDKTLAIAESLLKKYKGLRIISHASNQGRGAVLTNAFRRINGDIGVYIDADLAIDLKLYPRLIKEINSGADVAIGSKHLKNSEVQCTVSRRIASKGYSFLARLLLGSKIRDYQCGFKAFRKDVLDKILPYAKEKGWSWDTEVIVKSGWIGYKIAEVPAKVVNVYGRESKVHLFRDVRRMGSGLFRLWKEKAEYKKKKYKKKNSIRKKLND